MIGCAAIIGVVIFAIVSIAAFFSNDPNLRPAWGVGAMAGGMAFVAALILMIRDHSRHDMTMNYVRRLLLEREDVDEEVFCNSFPRHDSTLLMEVRDAVASFFDVPPSKIHPHDHLQQTFRIDVFDPPFVLHVVCFVLDRRRIVLDSLSTRSSGLNNLSDLADEIQAILKTAGKLSG